MERLKKTEIIILLILWMLSLSSNGIALLNDYVLFPSDYLGMVGLFIVSTISFVKPERVLLSVIVLLILGLFNLVSFAYFFNWVFTFGFSVLLTPGLQLISLIALVVLFVSKRSEVAQLYRETIGQTKEEKERVVQYSQNRFKAKFERLNDQEIDLKLQQRLVPEAMAALNEIKEERKAVLFSDNPNLTERESRF